MKKKIFMILLCSFFVIGLTTGCEAKTESGITNDNKEINDNSTSNLNDSDTNENTKNDENSITEEQDNNNNNNANNSKTNDYYVGTYYMALEDGSLAKDGSGTIILNKDKSCTYYYGWSDFGCQSFSITDHRICLKTTESEDDICFTLASTNDMLIDSQDVQYIKE